VRRLLLRVALFVTPGMALWALLPLVATQQLGLGADGYGAMFAALGAGAVVGALLLAQVNDRLPTNAMLTAAGVLYAASLAVTVLAPGLLTALAALVAAGVAWMATTSTLVAELQLFVPAWVRARGLGLYTVVFTGSQAVGSLIWGLVAEQAGLRASLLLAALVVAAGAAAGVAWRVPEVGHLDRAPAVYWAEARLAVEPEPASGPVLITVEYTVTREREPAFLEAMTHLRRSRRRTGASRWELYRDAGRPDRFVETFRVPSWEEHLRQHEGRLTAADQEIEDAVRVLSDPPPRADHLLPP